MLHVATRICVKTLKSHCAAISNGVNRSVGRVEYAVPTVTDRYPHYEYRVQTKWLECDAVRTSTERLLKVIIWACIIAAVLLIAVEALYYAIMG